MRNILAMAVVCCVSVASCSKPEPESKMTYNDSHQFNRFVEKLEEHSFPYREAGELSIFYPVSQTKLIESLAAEARTEFGSDCGVSFTSMEKHKLMESALKNEGIPYTVVSIDDGPRIKCSAVNRETFNELSMQVFKGEYSE